MLMHASGRRATIRIRRAALLTALIVITACASEGREGSPETTATSAPSGEPITTPAPATTSAPTTMVAPSTFVVNGTDESGPGITVTTTASGWRFDSGLAALFKGDEVQDVPEAAILLWSYPASTEFYVPSDPCQSVSTMPVDAVTMPDEISSALAAQVSRNASEPAEVTIGGYAGKHLTLHVPDDVVIADCEKGTYLTFATGDDPGARSQQGPGQVDELWVLDVDGSTVIVFGLYRPDTSSELVEEIRSITQSATFQLAG